MELSSVAVFRGVLQLRTMSALLEMLKDPVPENVGRFAAGLYKHSGSITEYITRALTEDENPYVRRKSMKREIPLQMESSLDRELTLFEKLCDLSADDVAAYTGNGITLPGWDHSPADLHGIYRTHISELFTKGYGIYSKYKAFSLRSGVITPILTPDPQRLCELHSYEIQRQKVIDNTLALLNGLPAANCLLYGDAGTGKSSTVKAVVNEYANKGLRLIEIKKEQLKELPLVMEQIAENPLKFIIFIDDLSFSADDEDFGMLKAVLEGSASSRASNAVIYATSNRRHLVRERFADRSGDDIHAGDTRQEQASLSERFGLRITFLKPDKQVYIEIVKELADQYGLTIPEDELVIGAESYALRRSGRSGRAARHYVESLTAELHAERMSAKTDTKTGQ